MLYGHFWEQIVLPSRLAAGDILYNPCNLAPLGYANNVLVLHDVIAMSHPQFYSRLFRQYYTTLIPKLVRRSRHVVTVSEFSKQQIIRYTGVDEDKVSAIYNGVSQVFSPTLRAQETTVRDKYDLKLPYVLYAGSLEPRKNVETLLKAFAYAQSTLGLEGYALVVAGNAHPNFAPANLPALPGVKFLGYVPDPDLPALYANAELFIYPSLCEGFGLPALEAMASGVVTLVSAETAMTEVVQSEDLHFPALDHRTLAEKMYYFLNHPLSCEAYRQIGLVCARQFTWDKTAQNTVKILTGV